MEITEIKKCKKARGRYNIYLDGRFGFSLAEEVLSDEGLKLGKELKKEDIEKLKSLDEKRKALNSAFHLLSFRQRSERELSERLTKKGYTEENINFVLDKLKKLHYLDDKNFVENWVKSRKHKRGKYILRQELFRKGVDKEYVEKELDKIDKGQELKIARDLIDKKKFKNLTSREDIYKKIGGYLKRKGFSYEIIKEVIDEKTKKSP